MNAEKGKIDSFQAEETRKCRNKLGFTQRGERPVALEWRVRGREV